MAETLRLRQEQQAQDQAKQILDLQQERLKRLSEPESPVRTAGNLALVYLFGGAIAHGAVLPRTETIVLEGTVATTEIADELAKAA